MKAPRTADPHDGAEGKAEVLKVGQAGGRQVGQVTGIAVDASRGALWMLHRGGNTFRSTTKLASCAILKLSLEGDILGDKPPGYSLLLT